MPISDEMVEKVAFYRPPENSDEMHYLQERATASGWLFTETSTKASHEPLVMPDLNAFEMHN